MSASEKPRRGHGEGSVFYDDNRQRWIALLDLGRDGTGRRQRAWRSAKTKSQALAILRDLQRTADEGNDPRGIRRTVRDAVDDFKVNGLNNDRAPSTRYKTTLYADRLADAMNNCRLRDLTVRDVERWLGALAKEGKTGKTRATLVEVRGAAAQVLDHAARLGWIPPERNAARLARLPAGAAPRNREVLDDDAVVRVLTAAAEDWYAPLLAFVAATGVRVGEAAALRWSDVDAQAGVVTIQRAVRIEPDGSLSIAEPKKRSYRRIEIPDVLVKALQAHHRLVAESALKAGRPAPDLAFPTTTGTLPDPNDLRRWLRRVATKAKVQLRGFHDFRHAVASSLADGGAVPVHVAALLGHATPRTTLAVYTHPMTPIAAAGMSRAAKLLTPAPEH